MDKLKVLFNKTVAALSALKARCKSAPRKRLLGTVLGFFAGLIIVSVAVGVMIYKFQSKNPFVRAWATMVPYPAAVVRWRVITYSEYVKDLTALQSFYAGEQDRSGLPAPTENVLEGAVVDRLVRNIALRAAAKDKGIIVTKDEIEAKFDETVTQVGTLEQAETLIKDLYGWDVVTFKKRVLFYYLLEQKLGESFSNVTEFDALMDSEIAKLKETRFLGK